MVHNLPYFACGKVVQGFGRGSKTLGTPTANLQQDVVDQLPPDFKTGIYFGWAKVDDGPVYPQVTSVGWNPYFKNQTKSMVRAFFYSLLLLRENVSNFKFIDPSIIFWSFV